MNDRIFDTVTRDAATAVTRRASLLSIGGAALAAAMAVPAIAEAGKSGKKNADKRCKKQKSQCLAAFAEFCASLEEPQICEAFLSPCCEPLTRCNAGEAITCILLIMAD